MTPTTRSHSSPAAAAASAATPRSTSPAPASTPSSPTAPSAPRPTPSSPRSRRSAARRSRSSSTPATTPPSPPSPSASRTRCGRPGTATRSTCSSTTPAARCTRAIADTTEEQFDGIFDVHVKGVFFLTQRLLPLLADGGTIVNVSSGLARFSFPGSGAYAAAKGAVEVLTRYLALELGGRGITVNTIAPGAIATDFSGGMVRDNAEMQAGIAAQTALGRVGQPDDVGGAIAALVTSSEPLDHRRADRGLGRDAAVTGGPGGGAHATAGASPSSSALSSDELDRRGDGCGGCRRRRPRRATAALSRPCRAARARAACRPPSASAPARCGRL